MAKTLRAWEPYEFCLRAFYKLHECHDFRTFIDWDIYWLSAISSVRAIWHVLSEQDLKGSKLRRKIFAEYSKENANWEILQSFVRNQRDRTLKKWKWDVVEQEFMLGGRHTNEFIPTHTALVFGYPNPEKQEVEVDERLQGEDPLRLLGIALDFLHRDLSMIEIALIKNIDNPFSGGVSEQEYGNSSFFGSAPNYYR